MVDPDQIAALREHFASGAAVSADRPDDTREPEPALAVTLHTLQLQLPVPASDAAIITTDGSSPEHLEPGARSVCGCAAVAADGRALIGWFDDPGIASRSQYTEWQGARLGLRLAAPYSAGITMITDCREVATQLKQIAAGKPPYVSAVGGHDLDADAEIQALTAGRRIRVIHQRVSGRDSGTVSRHLTGSITLARAAHTGAWLARRLAAGETDPAQHAEWIAATMAQAPSNRMTLLNRYRQHFLRDSQPT